MANAQHDIAPELLEQIREAFSRNIEESDEIQRLYQAIQAGTATYAERLSERPRENAVNGAVALQVFTNTRQAIRIFSADTSVVVAALPMIPATVGGKMSGRTNGKYQNLMQKPNPGRFWA